MYQVLIDVMITFQHYFRTESDTASDANDMQTIRSNTEEKSRYADRRL